MTGCVSLLQRLIPPQGGRPSEFPNVEPPEKPEWQQPERADPLPDNQPLTSPTEAPDQPPVIWPPEIPEALASMNAHS